MQLYTERRFGDLLTLLMLDERQYRSHQVCPTPGKNGGARVYEEDCPEMNDPARTMLGATQEQWFASAMQGASARWNIIAQQTLMAEADRGPQDRHIFWADGWDGYPMARQRLLDAIAASPVPVVAAMNGHSPAGGAVLALPCDRRVLADGTTRVGLNEVAVGLSPGPLIHALLTSLVGARWAAEMLTSGALLSCTQALDIGLVDALAPAAQVEEEAMLWLRQRLALPAQAYARTRRMVREPLVSLLSTATGPQRAATLRRFQEEWLSDEPRAVLRTVIGRVSAAR